MTRIDTVRGTATKIKDQARATGGHLAPYASSARDATVHYVGEAGRRIGPKLEKARENLPETAEQVGAAARRAKDSAGAAADVAIPKVSEAIAGARAAAEPVAGEAAARGAAAIAALRGRVSGEDVARLLRAKERRQRRRSRLVRSGGVLVVVGGACAACWKWWQSQSRPDWMEDDPIAAEPQRPTGGSSASGAARADDAPRDGSGADDGADD